MRKVEDHLRNIVGLPSVKPAVAHDALLRLNCDQVQ